MVTAAVRERKIILMRFIFRSTSELHRQLQWRNQCRSIVDATTHVLRDRALDHVVEREKNLRHVLKLRDFIKADSSKSLPLSVIMESKDSLRIPARPIEFVRKYSSIFEEYYPGSAVHPHVRLTPEILYLDTEEDLISQKEEYRLEAADRLLKLLMLCRSNRIPLSIINRLQWDLGLPGDYLQSIVPQFPDYFQMSKVDCSSGKVDALELVCWCEEIAVSFMEKRAKKRGGGYEKGMPLDFPSIVSKGFRMRKGMKKSVDRWQKLPYISPYENALNLPVNSDQSDKWAVGVLHELLQLLVSKKTDRENLLCFGDYVGIRSRMKKVFPRHPGIFYISSKNRAHTVVLKEAYKRHELLEKHPLMNLRNKFLHLMHTLKDERKVLHSKKKLRVGDAHGSEKGQQNAGNTLDSKNVLMSDDEVDDDDDNYEERESNEEDDENVASKSEGEGNVIPLLRTAKDRHGRYMGNSRIHSCEGTPRRKSNREKHKTNLTFRKQGDHRTASSSSRRRVATS